MSNQARVAKFRVDILHYFQFRALSTTLKYNEWNLLVHLYISVWTMIKEKQWVVMFLNTEIIIEANILGEALVLTKNHSYFFPLYTLPTSSIHVIWKFLGSNPYHIGTEQRTKLQTSLCLNAIHHQNFWCGISHINTRHFYFSDNRHMAPSHLI